MKMVVRELLPIGCLAVGLCLGATALAQEIVEGTQQASQDVVESSKQLDSTDNTDNSGAQPDTLTKTPLSKPLFPEADPLTIRDPLLSSLILPLPPLLLPDLLLPPYDFPTFNSQRLDQELQIYSRYLKIYGTPDVLIIGSSRSLQGIDPSALQEGLESRGYAGVKVFNFGINGATAQVMDLLLREVLTAEHLPKLIIWGDGLRAFNDGRLDITYNGIVASEGYRRLTAGDRPIPFRVYDQPPASLNVAAKSLMESPAVVRSQRAIAPDLDMYGFQMISEQFDPTTYYQQYPKVPGNFDSDYVPFALGREQTVATVAVARFAQQQNIPLVIVNLPLTADYMDATRRGYETEFLRHMQQLAQQEQFTFINLVQHPELIQNHYFADPSHINRHGARAIALELAADSQIPWDTLGLPIASPNEETPDPDDEALIGN